MPNEPFFRKTDGRFLPTRAGVGPWNKDSLHGRLIIGLLGAEIERQYRTPEYMPARLTVDMYRLPDLSPIEVVTRVVKDGYRIKVVDAEFISGGQSAGRATCQLLRRTENPPGNVWTPPAWDAPKPADIPEPQDRRAGMGGMWAMRPISGAFGSLGVRKTWMAEVRELVEGEPFTPFARVATAADFASPFANAGDQGLGYINTDLTLYLHREPVTEWVGFEVINHGASDGVAIGECLIHDERGPIGSASCTALAQKRKV
ncbi:MAG: thioesterase family protein [Phenylobacterium sp.]|uniref:acyl-CoA thioesterase domain-containing protein n=1 Tax=Phenylobacterium sp. TaxID=1871053 RepID=UPI0025F355D8|nr:acyl-CoA thioesterase domain-containing protein [Phenylobacterium sp.]MBI1199308.1 thioesterase family protein [Phenylobacterium sp.]